LWAIDVLAAGVVGKDLVHLNTIQLTGRVLAKTTDSLVSDALAHR
jgi:hypothetical protein